MKNHSANFSVPCAIAALLVSGCVSNPAKLIAPSDGKTLQFDYAMAVLDRSDSKEIKDCLAQVKDPSGIPMASKEEGLRDLSRCAFKTMWAIATVTPKNKVLPPPVSAKALEPLNPKAFDQMVSEVSVYSSSNLVISNIESEVGGDGLYRINSAKWILAGKYVFEISRTGLTYSYGKTKIFEPDSKTVLGAIRSVDVSSL